MQVRIDPSWQRVLQAEFDKPYFELLTQYVRQQYKTRRCFPPAGLIFNVGLSFSVPEGVQIPPSLMNIYKEIHRDLGTPIPQSGDLRRWAAQGVLLLNATLTVEAHKAGSHQGKGWEELTDAAIAALNREREHLVFMLWGSYAQRKGQFIDRRKHLVLQTSHPSPLSVYRGFDGCGHFSAANNYLINHGLQPINW